MLVNRTFDKAQALARELAGYLAARASLVRRRGWRLFPGRSGHFVQLARTDLVVNATTLGLRQSDRSPLPHALIAPHLMVYDLLYKKTRRGCSPPRQRPARAERTD